MNRKLAENQELEKAPAAVSVKIIRKATGKVQKGRAINVNYGIRSRKMIVPRRQSAKKDIAVGEGRKTVKRHISRVLMEGCEEKKAKGGAIDTTYYDLYRATWKQVEEEIDAVLDDLVKPVCDRTLEVAQSMDQSSSIPQLVPVIFHDATGLSSLDYTKYFRSTVLQFRRQGYTVIQFLSEDIALFRKMGVWSALYTLATEQNKDIGGSSSPSSSSGTQVNSAVAKRLLEELYNVKKTRMIIAAENIENLDKGILGEILFALSEVWESIPAILLMGQFVKKEYIYSVIPKNVLTKMYPTSVSIPSGYEMVEKILQSVLLGSALSSNLLLGPPGIRVLCEFLLDYQCSTHILKRFLKSVYLYHILRTPLHSFCMKKKSEVSAGMMRRLKLAMKLNTEDSEEDDVWKTYEEEEAKVQTSFRNFGIRIRMLDIAAQVIFKRKDVYLKLLKAGASSLNAEKRYEHIWRDGSLFHGLKKGVLKSSKQCLLGLIKCWSTFVEESVQSDGGNMYLSEMSEKLSSLVEFEARSTAEAVVPTPQKKAARPVVSRETSARGSRRQALQSHISSLADGSDLGASSSANRLAPFQRVCAEFLVSVCEVPHDQNPCTQLLARTLIIDGSRSTVDMIFPSIPNNMISSIKDPSQFLKYSEGKDSLQSMEDAAVVFHFVQGFSSSVAMEDVFGQFNDVVSGKSNGRTLAGKRKRGIKTSSKKSTESKEASNLRFERAIQELNLCGLIKINKRKMNKFVSAVFD